ncbi:MAG: hypothetical protein JXB07_19085 [Anaerolineae bacterium]|nr:hypothetical protein [Anaerolineae bacterium]
MTGRTYDFQTQLAIGQAAEQLLDAELRKRGYTVWSATRDDQRRGIDRWIARPPSERQWSIEYKDDLRAQHTGNAFVEVLSVDTVGRLGWAYTSQADYLLYYVHGDELVYVLKMQAVKETVPAWERLYRTVKVMNDGYNTHGVLVPLHELEALAEAVWNL